MIINSLLMKELFPFLEPPAFTNKPPSRVVVKRGSSLSLCCEVTGFPRPRIEWSRAQQSAYLSPYSQENGCLVVNTFKQNSDGDYVCRATNKFGLVETATTVIIVPFARGWVYSTSAIFSGFPFSLLFEIKKMRNNVYGTTSHRKVRRYF